MGEHKTSPGRIKATTRQGKAVEMRLKGLGYRDIAKQLSYSGPSGAFKAVKSALRKTLQEPSDELRKLELARLDKLQFALWPFAMASGDERQHGAVDRVLSIMKRRAALLGLDAPIVYSLEDIRQIARRVVGVIEAEVSDESIRERIFDALGFVKGGGEV